MAQIQPGKPGRKAMRYGIPVAVAGVAAVTVGLVPALASAGSPDLPKVTAQQLVAKMAASHTKHMSGTVEVDADLGLPQLPGMSGGAGGGQQGGGLFGGGAAGHGKKGGGASASPQQKLMGLSSGRHTLRVASDGPQKQRVSLVENAAEYSLIHNGKQSWAYDSGSNSVSHFTAPEGAAAKGRDAHKGAHAGQFGKGMQDATPQQAAKQALKAAKGSTSVSVDGTEQIAGRDAYQLVLKPKQATDSTIGSARIAVDAHNGAPLKFTLSPKSGGKPIVDVAYTKVDFGKPAASTFDFHAPKGAKVTEQKPGADRSGAVRKHLRDGAKSGHAGMTGHEGLKGLSGLDTVGKGWGSVAELKVPKGMLSGVAGDKAGKSAQGAQGAGQMLNSFTEPAKGQFGKGRVFSTRVVNALITDDGKVYAGAVTKQGLIKAADHDAAKH